MYTAKLQKTFLPGYIDNNNNKQQTTTADFTTNFEKKMKNNTHYCKQTKKEATMAILSNRI